MTREKWYASMLEKYGTEEAISTEMRNRQKRSMLNPNRQKGRHRGGFAVVEGLASAAGKKGKRGKAKSRRKNG